ncbi:MAG TPA: hypothetical protein VK769_01535, partial [Verrucomicrobiae bacterium]|nr:hypothetical protein [Verrucomicrobiae bacterium]
APILFRFETTNAKIKRIRLQFWIYILLGAISLFSSLDSISKSGTIDVIFRIVFLVLGIFLIGAAFWMRRRLLEACRAISIPQSQIINPKS